MLFLDYIFPISAPGVCSFLLFVVMFHKLLYLKNCKATIKMPLVYIVFTCVSLLKPD